jgi:hypothetical protein
MRKPPLERVTITIPQPLLAAADALAHQLDRSRSWVLAEAVRRLVDHPPTGESPSKAPAPVSVPAPAPPPLRKSQFQPRLARTLALSPANRLKAAEDRSHPSRLAEIARGLLDTESRFLVTGMVAEVLHGHFHPVRRVELLMRRTLENAVRLLAGLEHAGYPKAADILPEQLLDQASVSIAGSPGLVCYSSLPGFRYDQAEERADQFVLGGTRVPVMSVADLIALRAEGPLANEEDHAVLLELQTLTRRDTA